MSNNMHESHEKVNEHSRKDFIALAKALDGLIGFLEEVELQGHLFKMDVKDEWQDLRKQLTVYQQKLSHFTSVLKRGLDHGEIRGHLGMMELKEEWEKLQDLAEKMLGKGGFVLQKFHELKKSMTNLFTH